MLFKVHHIHGRKIFSVPILLLRKPRLRLISLPVVTQVIRKEGQCQEAQVCVFAKPQSFQLDYAGTKFFSFPDFLGVLTVELRLSGTSNMCSGIF